MTVGDAGRAAVAAAEAAAFGGTDVDEPVGRDALGALVSAVADGPWWARSGAAAVVVTTPRRGTRSSSARLRSGPGAVEIRLSEDQLTVATAAHELAHALAGVDHGHDAVFRSAYVDVVAVLADAAAAGALTDAFATFGLPVAPRSWPPPFRAEGGGFRMIP